MVKLIRFLFVCAVILAIAGCGLVGITIWYFGRDLPDYQQLAHYQPPIMTRVQAGDGRLLAEYAAERRIFVPIQAIPKRVIDAFVSAEDKNFYTHHGVDPVSIIRAAITDVGRLRSSRRPIGASTITQQVAKNMLLSNEVSLTRKIKEVLLATRIEAAMPKERILELYLNEIYLGSGAYGVAAAALTYFDKPLDDLSLGEAAFLGGLPKAPNRYNPAHFLDAATARRDWVLDRMVEDGVAARCCRRRGRGAAPRAAPPRGSRTSQSAIFCRAGAPRAARAVRRKDALRCWPGGAHQPRSTPPGCRRQGVAQRADRLRPWPRRLARGDRPYRSQGRLGRASGRGPVPAVVTDVGWRLAVVLRTTPGVAAIGFADGDSGHVPFAQMRWARPRHPGGSLGPFPRGAGDVVKPGDVVMVAPVPAEPARTDASDASKDTAGAAKETKKTAAAARDPAAFTLCQVPEVSGALVVMDPHTGRVLALSGGFSFAISQFDRATQAYRQTGSAIKPFVFLTALDHGFTPSSKVSDAPISLPQGPGLPMWTPTNYEGERFRGPTPLRIGLEQSIDTLTVRLATMIGMDSIAKTIESFGILDHVPHEYAITLGAGATTPLRLTTAYAMIVNGGKRITPTVIDRVQDRDGKTIFRADNRPCDGCSDDDWHHQPVPAMPDTREQVADPAPPISW